MSKRLRLLLSSISILALLVLFAPPAAQAQVCVPHLTYVDLIQGRVIDSPGAPIFVVDDPIMRNEVSDLKPALELPDDFACADKPWHSALMVVEIPPQCSRLVIWLDYLGDPDGWSVNIGDSATNNGFGGDRGTAPEGQNAEVEVVGEVLRVFSAADNPGDVDTLATLHLALRDGALRFTVEDQRLTWGQPFSALETPDLERLFFLPPNPVAPENRTIFIGINRVVFGPGNRIGCGVSKALVMFE